MLVVLPVIYLWKKRYDGLDRCLKGILIIKEVIFRCCKEVLCAVCMGFGCYRACFVRSLVRVSTPILEGMYVFNV